MTAEEAIAFYLDKKRNGELERAEIKKRLIEHDQFTAEEATDILKEISNRELNSLHEKNSVVAQITDSAVFSWIFLFFGLVVIGVSVYFILQGLTQGIKAFLPWIMIVGGLFLMVKHGTKIYRLLITRSQN